MRVVILLAIIMWAPISKAQLSDKEVHEVFSEFHSLYDPTLKKDQEIVFNPPLRSNLRWLEFDLFNARFHKIKLGAKTIYNIFITGGVSRAPGMTKDTLASFICHELGHGFAGGSLKENGSSTEGESDYYSMGECLTAFMKRNPLKLDGEALDLRLKDKCMKTFTNKEEINFCIRKFIVLADQVVMYKVLEKKEGSIFKKDYSVADKINRTNNFYPEFQCRIDTMRAGILKQERPACWFVNK